MSPRIGIAESTTHLVSSGATGLPNFPRSPSFGIPEHFHLHRGQHCNACKGVPLHLRMRPSLSQLWPETRFLPSTHNPSIAPEFTRSFVLPESSQFTTLDQSGPGPELATSTLTNYHETRGDIGSMRHSGHSVLIQPQSRPGSADPRCELQGLSLPYYSAWGGVHQMTQIPLLDHRHSQCQAMSISSITYGLQMQQCDVKPSISGWVGSSRSHPFPANIPGSIIESNFDPPLQQPSFVLNPYYQPQYTAMTYPTPPFVPRSTTPSGYASGPRLE